MNEAMKPESHKQPSTERSNAEDAPEHGAPRTERATYELKDADGAMRCVLHAEYRHERSEDNEQDVRLLEGLTIESDGGVVDLFDEANGVRKASRIVIAEKEYAYNYMTDTAEIPEPKSLLDLYVALHELGHGAQFQEPLFERMVRNENNEHAGHVVAQFDGIAEWAERNNKVIDLPDDVTVKLRELSRAYDASSREVTKSHASERYREIGDQYFHRLHAYAEALPPDVKNAISDRVWDLGATIIHAWKRTRVAIEEILAERDLLIPDAVQTLAAIASEFEPALDRLDAERQKPRQIEERFLEASAAYPEMMHELAYQIPTAITERDATLRAFKWGRAIGKSVGTPMNFSVNSDDQNLLGLVSESLGDVTIEDMQSADTPEIERALARLNDLCANGRVSPRDAMDLALTTYGAETPRFRTAFRPKSKSTTHTS